MPLINPSIIPLASLWRRIVRNNRKAFALYAAAFLLDGILIAIVATAVAPLADYFLDRSFANASAVTRQYISALSWLNLKPTLEVLLSLFVIANLIKAGSSILLYLYTRRFAYLTVHDLARNCLTAYLSSSLLFFLSHPIGTLHNTMQKESEKLGDGIAALFTFFAVFAQVLMLSYVAWALSHTMLVICLSMVVLFLAMTRWLDRHVQGYAALTTSSGNVMIQNAMESLVGAKLILAYGRGTAMVERFSSSYKRMANVAVKAQVLATTIPTLYTAFGILSVSVALYVAVGRGESLATLMAALWALLRIVPLIAQMVSSLTNTTNVIPSFIQYNDLIEQARRLSIGSGTTQFTSLEKGIEFRNVSFSYPGRDAALAAALLSIPKGSFTAFVGESGSGKTTTADLLLRLLAPGAGKIFIDERPLEEFDTPSFLERIGYVPQESFLFNATIRENLSWSMPSASEADMWAALKQANIDEFVAGLSSQLDTVVGDRGASLSGGQRQRIALARALLKKPDILILDEATSALDSDSERLIMKSIDTVAPFTTIIVIAHRLSTVARADQVCVFNAGQIVEIGPYAKLRNTPGSRLYQLINLQDAGLVA